MKMIKRNIVKGLNLACDLLSQESVNEVKLIYSQLFKNIPISIRTNGKSPSTIEACIFYIIVNKEYMNNNGKVVYTLPCLPVKQVCKLFGVSKTSIVNNHKLIYNMIQKDNIYIPEIKYIYN